MKFRAVFTLRLCIFLLSASSILFAQTQEEQGHVFVISTWKIGFDNLEAYLDMFQKEYKPIADENEYLKSIRVFTHLYGPDWNVVVIREFENVEAMAKSETRQNEIFMKKYPDKSKRDEYMKKVGGYIVAHTDAVVQEVPKLRK